MSAKESKRTCESCVTSLHIKPVITKYGHGITLRKRSRELYLSAKPVLGHWPIFYSLLGIPHPNH